MKLNLLSEIKNFKGDVLKKTIKETIKEKGKEKQIDKQVDTNLKDFLISYLEDVYFMKLNDDELTKLYYLGKKIVNYNVIDIDKNELAVLKKLVKNKLYTVGKEGNLIEHPKFSFQVAEAIKEIINNIK